MKVIDYHQSKFWNSERFSNWNQPLTKNDSIDFIACANFCEYTNYIVLLDAIYIGFSCNNNKRTFKISVN